MSKSNNKITIIALMVVFLAPPILSWLIYSFGDVAGGKKNHGTLIQPPRNLPDITLHDEFNSNEKSLYGKWSIVFVQEGICEKVCVDSVYKMRQVRLATNKYAHRLQRILIVDSNTPELFNNILVKDYEGQLLIFRDQLQEGLMENFIVQKNTNERGNGQFFIIDPLGNIMMTYEASADPIGMIEDLTHLIKISRIG